MISVKVSSKEFQTYISSVLNVDRSGVSLKITNDYIESLVLSEDNSSIILYAKLNILEIDGLEGDQIVVHVKDLTKFQKLLDLNRDETFTFKINDNHVYYENGEVVGAKFMLSDRPSKQINAAVSVEWFNKFVKTSKMTVNKAAIKKIIQCSSFTSDDANKVYLYEDSIIKYRPANTQKATHVYDKVYNTYRLPKIEIPKFVYVKPRFKQATDNDIATHYFDTQVQGFVEGGTNEELTHVLISGHYREVEGDEVATHYYDAIKGEYRLPNPPEVPTHEAYKTKGVVAELNDKTKSNLDTMSLYVCELQSGSLVGKAIINVNTLSRLFLADEMTMETSLIGEGVSQTEIVFLSFTNDNVSVRYLLNTLRS